MVAICFYGLPRGNPRCVESVIRSIGEKSHVFSHMWSTNQITPNWHGYREPSSKNLMQITSAINSLHQFHSQLIELQIKHEPLTVKTEDGRIAYHSNQLNMWLSIQKVLHLAEAEALRLGSGYTHYIFVRTDIYVRPNSVLKIDRDHHLNHSGNTIDSISQCEDLFFVVRQDSVRTIDQIVSRVRELFYTNNSVNNPLLYEFYANGMRICNHSLSAERQILIFRPLDLKRIGLRVKMFLTKKQRGI